MTIVIIVAVVALWMIVGLAARVPLLRRGHRHMSWGTAAFIGPFVIVAALLDARRHPRQVDARLVAFGEPASGPVDTLVGIDASPEARAALFGAVDVLGSRIGRLVIATVLPSDFPDPAERQRAEFDALDMLEESRADLERKVAAADGLAADLILLRGSPADALVEYASNQDIAVIAVGKRGTGLAKAVLGSVAMNLARDARAAVLIVGD